MKLLSYNKKIIKLMSVIIIFLAILLLQSKSKAIQIQGGHYKVDEENKIISRIEPETTVEKFKKKIIDDENKIKIYKEKECNNEVTDGFVGTGMYVKENENLYQLSVVGDFDGDGKATQVELTNTIRHIVGLKDSKLEGIKYISADITGDEQVDQRDITKFIRYIVFGELDLGKNDTTPPTLELTTVKQMSNEITIKVTAQDNESGLGENPIYVFYVRKANETEDKNVKFYEGTNTQVELKNLEQNTNYIITATAKDKAGNKGRTSMQALTAKIPDGTEQGAIIFGNTQWKNQKASVEISTNIKRDDFASEEGTVDEKYNIEYQVNGTNGNWQKAEQEKITVTDLKNGDIVYARLTDGINSSSYISKNILDEVSPRIDIEVIEDNQNKQITAKVVNAQDNESGLEENPRYKFYIKETNEPDSAYVEKQNTIEKTYIFKNLNVNTKYTIKAEVKDKAGNIGIAEKIIDIKEITDVQAPTVDLEIINQTTNGAKVKATATDEGGLPTPTIYKFYIKEKDKADNIYREVQSTESNICDITGLKQNTNYTIKVTVEDKAGNVGEKEKDLLTKTITDITTEGAITFEGPVWNDKKAQVTIKTNTEYYIEYQVNGTTGEWTKGTNAGSDVIVSGLKNNDVIYARLTDGINNSNYTVLTIVDGIEPEDFNVTVSNITNDGFTISGSTTDKESGIKDYTYVVKSSDGTETKYENKTETSYTVTGLEEGTEYTVYMVAYDNAGNEKKSEEQIVTTTRLEITVTEPYIGTSNTETDASKSVEDNSQSKGTTLYINFIAKAGDTNCKITLKSTGEEITLPYAVTKNGTYTFIASTTNGAKTEEIEVNVNKYVIIGSYVQYDAGNWTQSEIQELQNKSLYMINKERNMTTTYRLENSEGLSFTFGGFTYKGDTTNQSDINNGTVITSRNQSTANKNGTPKYTGWKVFKTEEKNGKTYITSLIHAGSPENFVGVPIIARKGNDNLRIEYLLSGGTRKTEYNTLSTGTIINPRNLDMYKDATLDSEGYIQGVHVMTFDEMLYFKDIKSRFPVKEIEQLGNIGSYYWIARGGTWASDNDSVFLGVIDYNYLDTNDMGYCAGIRPVIELNKGIYIESGEGTEANPYVLGKDTLPDIVEGAITFSSPTWYDRTAMVDINTTEVSFYLEYQINGTTGTWTRASEVGKFIRAINLKNNDILYARLTDGINSSNYTTLTIVDTIKPNEFNITVSDVKPDGFTISGSTTDDESGIKDYTYVVKSSDGTETKYENKTETSYTVTGLEKGTEYTVYMVAYDNAGNEKKSAEQVVTTVYEQTPISKTEHKVGYYADIDGDGTVDGVIYADLAVGNTSSGQWGTNDEGNYSIPTKIGLKDYYVSQKNYNGTFGTKDVISPVKSSTGEERFYVMALKDIVKEDKNTFDWYNVAASGKMNDYSSTTSGNFGTGKANTSTMITKWNSKAYGEQNQCSEHKDMWGQIQTEISNGWFVPSRGEWSAFAKELGITNDNYQEKGLSNWYWSSSQLYTYNSYVAHLIIGYIDGGSVDSNYYVRLSATF